MSEIIDAMKDGLTYGVYFSFCIFFSSPGLYMLRNIVIEISKECTRNYFFNYHTAIDFFKRRNEK